MVGFARNSRLAATVEPLVEQVQADYDDSGEKQRQFTELVYQADSWDRERRMVAKDERGFNRRFVVTNRQDLTAGQLYDHYIGCENFADRLSCHRFLANQFRLFIHALAYVLIATPWHNLEIERSAAACSKSVPGFGKLLVASGCTWHRLIPNKSSSALLMHRLCPT